MVEEAVFGQTPNHLPAHGTARCAIGARVVLVIVDAVDADAACGCWSFPAVFTWLPDERLKLFTCDVNFHITFLCIPEKAGPAALLHAPIVAGHWMRWLSYEGEHTHSALTARIVFSSAVPRHKPQHPAVSQTLPQLPTW